MADGYISLFCATHELAFPVTGSFLYRLLSLHIRTDFTMWLLSIHIVLQVFLLANCDRVHAKFRGKFFQHHRFCWGCDRCRLVFSCRGIALDIRNSLGWLIWKVLLHIRSFFELHHIFLGLFENRLKYHRLGLWFRALNLFPTILLISYVFWLPIILWPHRTWSGGSLIKVYRKFFRLPSINLVDFHGLASKHDRISWMLSKHLLPFRMPKFLYHQLVLATPSLDHKAACTLIDLPHEALRLRSQTWMKLGLLQRIPWFCYSMQFQQLSIDSNQEPSADLPLLAPFFPNQSKQRIAENHRLSRYVQQAS